MSLGFTADIESTLSIQPNLVSLGAIGKEEQVKKLIRLKGAQPFKILGIESQTFDVSATKLDEESKDMHLVPLVFSPKSLVRDKSEQKGKIFLLTDMDARPKLELDVVYRIKEDPVPLSASIK